MVHKVKKPAYLTVILLVLLSEGVKNYKVVLCSSQITS